MQRINAIDRVVSGVQKDFVFLAQLLVSLLVNF